MATIWNSNKHAEMGEKKQELWNSINLIKKNKKGKTELWAISLSLPTTTSEWLVWKLCDFWILEMLYKPSPLPALNCLLYTTETEPKQTCLRHRTVFIQNVLANYKVFHGWVRSVWTGKPPRCIQHSRHYQAIRVLCKHKNCGVSNPCLLIRH